MPVPEETATSLPDSPVSVTDTPGSTCPVPSRIVPSTVPVRVWAVAAAAASAVAARAGKSPATASSSWVPPGQESCGEKKSERTESTRSASARKRAGGRGSVPAARRVACPGGAGGGPGDRPFPRLHRAPSRVSGIRLSSTKGLYHRLRRAGGRPRFGGRSGSRGADPHRRLPRAQENRARCGSVQSPDPSACWISIRPSRYMARSRVNSLAFDWRPPWSHAAGMPGSWKR